MPQTQFYEEAAANNPSPLHIFRTISTLVPACSLPGRARGMQLTGWCGKRCQVHVLMACLPAPAVPSPATSPSQASPNP